MTRRGALRMLAAVLAGAVTGARALGARAAAAWNKEAFAAQSVDEVVKTLGGTSATPTKDVSWGSTPEIAENGAVVPVSVTSQVPGTDAVAIVIEKNPNKLAAHFTFPEGTDTSVTTRVKISESSNVHALVHTKDGKFFVATREIKVTLGGCGG